MNDLAISRRVLLGGAAGAGFGLAYAGSLEAFARPDPRHPGGNSGYGPLVPDRVTATISTRSQAYAEPVTRSRKLEGAWWGNGGAYFVASSARPEANGDGSLNAHDGQVWFYDPESRTITLKTLFAPNPQSPEQPGTWDGPDNITVSPHGGLILAEDGNGKNHLIGVDRRGDPYALARNERAQGGEFCGPAFSADGRILFATIQSPTYGATLAITGPWRRDR